MHEPSTWVGKGESSFACVFVEYVQKERDCEREFHYENHNCCQKEHDMHCVYLKKLIRSYCLQVSFCQQRVKLNRHLLHLRLCQKETVIMFLLFQARYYNRHIRFVHCHARFQRLRFSTLLLFLVFRVVKWLQLTSLFNAYSQFVFE